MALLPTDDGNMTGAEVAVAAALSQRYVNQVIEERVMPTALFTTGAKRRFLPSAAAFAALSRSTAAVLTRAARQRFLRQLLLNHRREFTTPYCWRRWALFPDDEKVELGLVSVRVSSVLAEVAKRVGDIFEARALIVSDPEILSGTPVISGTRVPAYDIAASVESGAAINRLCDGWGVDERQVELAHIWAKSHPRMGRPKRALAQPPLDARVERIARTKRST